MIVATPVTNTLALVGILLGFAPWVVYWLLVANVPFALAAVVALVVAIGVMTTGRGGATDQPLGVGAVGTFAVLTLLSLTLSDWFLERWSQPLSIAGLFLAALLGAASGKPFVREFAAAGRPPEMVKSDMFEAMSVRLSWLWVGLLGVMTISAMIPPVVSGNASVRAGDAPLSYVFYWLIPVAVWAVGAFATMILPDRMTAGFGDAVRKTTFVAYSEASIDELYYLAREHAGREVGSGQEAYDIKVGGAGVPLVGDDSRLSWPSTYKVRERHR